MEPLRIHVLRDSCGNPFQQHMPLDIYNIITTVECLTATQLDDWYEKHVGYRPSDEDVLSPRQHAVIVASMMLHHVRGVDNAYADDGVALIERYFGVQLSQQQQQS